MQYCGSTKARMLVMFAVAAEVAVAVVLAVEFVVLVAETVPGRCVHMECDLKLRLIARVGLLREKTWNLTKTHCQDADYQGKSWASSKH
jgi:hypothetical protein